MTKLLAVKVAGRLIGWTPFQSASDILGEEIYALRGDYAAGVAGRRGELHCTRPPYGPHAEKHPLSWAEVEGDEVLYCAACQCLVTWPHDGYTYASEYPAEWLAQVAR